MVYSAVLFYDENLKISFAEISDEVAEHIESTKNATLKKERANAYAFASIAYCKIFGKQMPKISFLKSGKPILLDCDEHISISHTDGACAVAFSKNPVGIDVEKIDKKRDISKFVARFVNNDLQKELISCEKAEHNTLFFKLNESESIEKISQDENPFVPQEYVFWTSLEAVLKADEGFSSYPTCDRLIKETKLLQASHREYAIAIAEQK